MSDRRSFLKKLGLGAATLAVPKAIFSKTNNEPSITLSDEPYPRCYGLTKEDRKNFAASSQAASNEIFQNTRRTPKGLWISVPGVKKDLWHRSYVTIDEGRTVVHLELPLRSVRDLWCDDSGRVTLTEVNLMQGDKLLGTKCFSPMTLTDDLSVHFRWKMHGGLEIDPDSWKHHDETILRESTRNFEKYALPLVRHVYPSLKS